MHSQYEAILLDFDGVLADTEPLHFECWRSVLAPIGIGLDWDYYRTRCIGISDRDMLKALGERAEPPKQLDELLPLYPSKKKMFRELSCSRQIIDEGLTDMLKICSCCRLGVVTSSGKAEIEPILLRHGIMPLLAVTVYGNEVRNLKPHPEPYRTAVERLGVTRVLVLEDSDAGVESARGAGCDVIRVGGPAEVPAILRRVCNVDAGRVED